MIKPVVDQLYMDRCQQREQEGVDEGDKDHGRIVGWAMDEQMTDALTQRALQMAQRQRKPQTHHLLHHSDRGSHYTSDD